MSSIMDYSLIIMTERIIRILNLIDFSIQRIKVDLDIYTRFSKSIQWIGMSKMLNSMIDLQKEHQKELIQLRQSGNLESIFLNDSQIEKKEKDFFQNVNFLEGMDYIDFLSMVILEQEEYIRLYEYLMSLSMCSDVIHIFKYLSDDAKKQRLWALDRYELEILTL